MLSPSRCFVGKLGDELLWILGFSPAKSSVGAPKQPAKCGYNHKNRCFQPPQIDSEARTTERVFPRKWITIVLTYSNQSIDGRLLYLQPRNFNMDSLENSCKPDILTATKRLLDITSNNKKSITSEPNRP